MNLRFHVVMKHNLITVFFINLFFINLLSVSNLKDLCLKTIKDNIYAYDPIYVEKIENECKAVSITEMEEVRLQLLGNPSFESLGSFAFDRNFPYLDEEFIFYEPQCCWPRFRKITGKESDEHSLEYRRIKYTKISKSGKYVFVQTNNNLFGHKVEDASQFFCLKMGLYLGSIEFVGEQENLLYIITRSGEVYLFDDYLTGNYQLSTLSAAYKNDSLKIFTEKKVAKIDFGKFGCDNYVEKINLSEEGIRNLKFLESASLVEKHNQSFENGLDVKIFEIENLENHKIGLESGTPIFRITSCDSKDYICYFIHNRFVTLSATSHACKTMNFLNNFFVISSKQLDRTIICVYNVLEDFSNPLYKFYVDQYVCDIKFGFNEKSIILALKNEILEYDLTSLDMSLSQIISSKI